MNKFISITSADGDEYIVPITEILKISRLSEQKYPIVSFRSGWCCKITPEALGRLRVKLDVDNISPRPVGENYGLSWEQERSQ